MTNIWNLIVSFCVTAGGKILAAAVVLIVGCILIKYVMKLVKKAKGLAKLDATVANFAMNFIKALLYVVLVVIVISILGIPIASVVTVLASAGVAIGLALQGALSNIAGGIMIVVFKPFKLGDYVEAAGQSGTVTNISLFYTTLLTLDNKRVTIPNSAITGGSVVDYSAEDTRRVDLAFKAPYGTDIDLVRGTLLGVAESLPQTLKDPEPFVRLSDHKDSALEFTVRVWCKSDDYWDVYFDLIEKANRAFKEKGIEVPVPRMNVSVKQ